MNRGLVYREQIGAAGAGETVLDYHVRQYAQRSRAHWSELIEDGRLHVNGRAASAELRLCAGDLVEVHRLPWREPDAPAHFGVVHEDEHVLVLDKPAGLQVLPAGPFHERTLLRLVQGSAPERAQAAPVHRLGRGTSGLILFGKTGRARSRLSSQFRDGSARKTYLALAEGAGLPLSLRARQPIGRLAHGPLQLHCAQPDGRASLTRLRVLARAGAAGPMLVAAQPITGRPDQIRVHLAACGAPILGDPLFGPGGLPKSELPPGAGGYHLHAAALRVRHPVSEAWIKWRVLPPWLPEWRERLGLRAP